MRSNRPLSPPDQGPWRSRLAPDPGAPNFDCQGREMAARERNNADVLAHRLQNARSPRPARRPSTTLTSASSASPTPPRVPSTRTASRSVSYHQRPAVSPYVLARGAGIIVESDADRVDSLPSGTLRDTMCGAEALVRSQIGGECRRRVLDEVEARGVRDSREQRLLSPRGIVT